MPSGTAESAAVPEDEYAELIAANTDTERLDRGRPISFDVALLHCELHPSLGSAWIHAPGRWDTSDGCVPVRIVWAYFRALELRRAIDAMDTARGIGLALADSDKSARAWDDVLGQAYPPIAGGLSDGE